jgi:dTDP-glucose 4,6-dehydratase
VGIALVTGGAGFIGRELVSRLYERGHHIVVVDKGTYAARFDLLAPYRDRLRLIEQDASDLDHLYGCDVLFHLAAESHVDNSITDARKFVETNVGATYKVLELIRGQRPHDRPTLIHVSTDEVYGDLEDDPASTEFDPLWPSNPYSASKAAGDMLVLAWQRTYGLRARIVRPSNCYGIYQYPEKLIPKTIRSWQMGRPMTVHGDGSQTRSWLAVEDCARALLTIWGQGQDGGIYNIPGNCEASVRSVVRRVMELCGGEPKMDYNCERPGGDLRYRVDGKRLQALGWTHRGNLWRDLPAIVRAELDQGIHL